MTPLILRGDGGKAFILQLVRTPIRLYLTKRGIDGWTELASREYQPSGVPGRRNLVALDLFEQ